jgi:pimeloyl-ACP methyl ester carboxylesterase
LRAFQMSVLREARPEGRPGKMLGMKPVLFRSSGRTLAGRLYGPAPSRAGLLFIHGLHSDQAGYRERAEPASERLGAVCLTFDLSGLADVIAAYDRLIVEHDVDPKRIGVVGASYGGFLAALLTARRPVTRLLMRAPVLYENDELDLPLALREKREEPPPESAALDAVATFSGPVLIVESEMDESVPHAIIEAYRAACPTAQHHLIPGAGHELSHPEWRAEFVAAIVDFLSGL